MIFIAMALPAMILMVQAQRDYEEKMEILYAVLEQPGEERESVDIVTGLLKGQRLADAADAERRLALYGFHADFANRYKKSLYLDWAVIIAIFLLVSVGFVALLLLTDKKREQMRKLELLRLQERVTALRDSAGGGLYAHPRRGSTCAEKDYRLKLMDARHAGKEKAPWQIASETDAQHTKKGKASWQIASETDAYAGAAEGRRNMLVTVQPRTSHYAAKSVRKHRVEMRQANREAVFAWLDACNRKPEAELLHVLEDADEDLGRLLMEFDALADSIELFGLQAGAEREGTKALVTDISHQLKTPVAALKTSFEVLQSGDLNEMERQEFLGRCGVQILRLEELVSALVNISRMETGMIELRKEERRLFDTILLAVNRIYPRAEEREIEIELEAAEELQQIRVLHDVRWLCEAFLNVLENAVKYSARRTTVTIRMIRMTVYVRVEIEDEGIGIPRKEWNKIFQRFYRGEAETVQRESGSGVGLYLAREIASRHEGTLVVAAPRHGRQGSCFVFQLPYLL